MMKKPALILTVALSFLTSTLAAAHHGDRDKTEKLGHVHFETSCAAAVQKNFDRAVAMLHSFWFPLPWPPSTRCSRRTPPAPWPSGERQ
jgi:hypothetical protein